VNKKQKKSKQVMQSIHSLFKQTISTDSERENIINNKEDDDKIHHQK